jgi:hypothetical protein
MEQAILSQVSLIPDDVSDPLLRMLSCLPSAVPSPASVDRVRVRCHDILTQRQHLRTSFRDRGRPLEKHHEDPARPTTDISNKHVFRSYLSELTLPGALILDTAASLITYRARSHFQFLSTTRQPLGGDCVSTFRMSCAAMKGPRAGRESTALSDARMRPIADYRAAWLVPEGSSSSFRQFSRAMTLWYGSKPSLR